MNQGLLNKVTSILIENDKSEVMSIAFSAMKSILMCGHKSGVISAWSPDPMTTLKSVGYSKFHDGAINKIFFKNQQVGNATEQFVMTCSSDGTLKVFKSDTFENIASKNFDSGVLDLFQSIDYEKNQYFIVSLENGDIIGLNLVFEVTFKVPSTEGGKV